MQGATIKTDEETGKIIIARIMHGGAADRSGLIHVGDEVIEVNGINVEGKTPNDVLAILVSRVRCMVVALANNHFFQSNSKIQRERYFSNWFQTTMAKVDNEKAKCV